MLPGLLLCTSWLHALASNLAVSSSSGVTKLAIDDESATTNAADVESLKRNLQTSIGAADDSKAVTKISISESPGERFRDYLSSVAFQIKICTKTPTWSTSEVKKIWWILSISIFCAYYRFLTRFLSGYLQKVTSVDLVYGMRRLLNVRSGNGSHQCILGAMCVSAYSRLELRI